MTGHSGRIVGYTEAIHFDGLPPTRGSVTDPRFRCATPARNPFYVKLTQGSNLQNAVAGP